MQTVLVGVDRSDASTRAMEFAVARAKLNDWNVHVLYVINWSPFEFHTPEENEHRHAERQREIDLATEKVVIPMMSIAKDSGVQADSHVRHGKPSQVLADMATELRADLIVVGRTGDSGLREAIFGSTASRLVQHAPVPVTVVP